MGKTFEVIAYYDNLRTDNLEELASEFDVMVTLEALNGEDVFTGSYPFELEPPIRHELYRGTFPVNIPEGIDSGTYWIRMQIVDRKTGLPVEAFSHRLGERLGEEILAGTAFVYRTDTELDDELDVELEN